MNRPHTAACTPTHPRLYAHHPAHTPSPTQVTGPLDDLQLRSVGVLAVDVLQVMKV